MIAIDTNVVLRIVLGDDAAQGMLVRRLMERDRLFVSLTVLLETGWVLQSRYRMSRGDVADVLALLVTLDGLVISRRAQTVWAIERYRGGADLGDMVHLVSVAKIGTFATFDRHLARDAGPASPVPIETFA